MRTLHRLTATIDVVRPLPTEDGARVVGTVEVMSECSPSGRAHMRCRVAGDDTWHPVAGGSADLADPADLPFHHSVTLSRLSAQPHPRAGEGVDSVAFYFCDDLDAPPRVAAAARDGTDGRRRAGVRSTAGGIGGSRSRRREPR